MEDYISNPGGEGYGGKHGGMGDKGKNNIFAEQLNKNSKRKQTIRMAEKQAQKWAQQQALVR